MIKKFLLSLSALALIVGGSLALSGPVEAIGSITEGANEARGNDQPSDLFGATGVFTKVSNILLFLIGAIAVIMIIFGGIRYVISGGNATQVQGAKNTIMYALVGIIVALLAYAAVNFVIVSFVPSSGTGGTGTNGASVR
ncbi:MAG: hypothetical protein WAQ22_04305 [Candidatus Saccharimonas sp.]